MNTARKNLDWDGMRAAALDPELLDARREPHKSRRNAPCAATSAP